MVVWDSSARRGTFLKPSICAGVGYRLRPINVCVTSFCSLRGLMQDGQPSEFSHLTNGWNPPTIRAFCKLLDLAVLVQGEGQEESADGQRCSSGNRVT